MEKKINHKMEVKMSIDRKKCSDWIDLFFKYFEMTKKLNKNEKKYIESLFLMVFSSEQFHELRKNIKN